VTAAIDVPEVAGSAMKIVNVVGARPNFMKIGPIIDALRRRSEKERTQGRSEIAQILVHTGQHYDRRMSELFFDQLGIPAPDINLEVGSGTHAVQTAQIMTRFEGVCLEHLPTHVLVVGDVNSTIACALVAVKLGISVVHVEAGLRSFDRTMPEEINRILTDAIADHLFTTEQSANDNLKREGIPPERTHFVGNVMIDTLLNHIEKAQGSSILEVLGLASGRSAVSFGVLTLHRAAAVDDRQTLGGMLSAVRKIAQELPIVFPVHPRTKTRIDSFGFRDLLQWGAFDGGTTHGYRKGIVAVDPLGYLDFLKLMSCARVVLTDSGGIQEETTILGVPCVTLRDSTERPITVTQGTNVLAGTKTDDIISRTFAQLQKGSQGNRLYETPGASDWHPPLWDGKAADRIADILLSARA
jgi:UDP-N-acetylglucosamine 2-epimerase (non-hydrolysing)